MTTDKAGRKRRKAAPSVGSPPSSAESFAGRLRELRTQRKLSQTELAGRVGLHYNQIGRYERGDSHPTAAAVKRLADALGVSTDYLIEGTRDAAAKARFEDRDLLRQFEEIEKLSEEDKLVVKNFLEALIFRRKVQGMATL